MPVPGPHLRLYQPSDFEALHRIDQACFPKRIAYGRDELRIYLHSEGAHCIVAEMSGKIAGFIVSAFAGETGHIITLDVLESCRRQSVGSRLLEAAEKEAAARGVRRMVLETAIANYPAIALWTKHGYRQFVTIKDYYGHGLDAFEMHKLLERKSQAKAHP